MNVQNGMGAGVNGNNVKKLNIWYGTTSLGEAFKEKAPFLLGIAQITLPPCTQFGQLFHFWTSVKINLARGSPPPIQTMPGRKGFFSGRASIIYSSSVLCMGDKGLKVFKKGEMRWSLWVRSRRGKGCGRWAVRLQWGRTATPAPTIVTPVRTDNRWQKWHSSYVCDQVERYVIGLIKWIIMEWGCENRQ